MGCPITGIRSFFFADFAPFKRSHILSPSGLSRKKNTGIKRTRVSQQTVTLTPHCHLRCSSCKTLLPAFQNYPEKREGNINLLKLTFACEPSTCFSPKDCDRCYNAAFAGDHNRKPKFYPCEFPSEKLGALLIPPLLMPNCPLFETAAGFRLVDLSQDQRQIRKKDFPKTFRA